LEDWKRNLILFFFSELMLKDEEEDFDLPNRSKVEPAAEDDDEKVEKDEANEERILGVEERTVRSKMDEIS
jgi:hypothetical protein